MTFKFLSLFITLTTSLPLRATEKSDINRKSGEVLIETVGYIQDQVYTTRDVTLSDLIEKTINKKTNDLGAPVMLLEISLSREAQSFSVAQVAESQVSEVVNEVKSQMNQRPEVSRYGFTEAELKEWVLLKLAAKEFVKIKKLSMRGQINDLEAQSYFDKNKSKFVGVTFDSVKENIKTFLSQQQLEERLSSWFDIIKRKYKVRETQVKSVN